GGGMAGPERVETPPGAAEARPGGGGATPAGRVKAPPVVRKLALELGVDLSTVAGTGPGGRVLAADVQAAARGPAAAPAPARSEDGGLGWLAPGRHPLRGVRRITAQAMGRSWAEIPHITTMDEIDASGLLAARRRLRDAGVDVTLGALLVAAAARGLRRFPLFNAWLDGSEIVVAPEVNVGLAVATADGLVVPVVRRADERPLADLAAEVRRLTAAARERTVDVADLRGGTFTISNYGALGGRFATPLIRPGEAGILGFGAIRERPFVVDGALRARPTLPWSLSADHRVIDGDVATAFGEYTTGLLADPVALLAELLVAGSG
ncbi:MAG TPA: dihydrolipoamide acetyltransferase family protein, partial [Acidimicrobiia bacterium]|nr:dihydrolipoamide acetyltransferase family protein [Acidimicrobiia bacterium]